MAMLETYWQNVADAHGLTVEECDALAAHLATDPDMTVSTTSRSVIADALRPVVSATLKASQGADTAVSRAVGADIGHGMLTDGAATVTLYASTADYMLTCVSTGERVGYRVNRDAYATPEAIPATYRKARTLATAFQAAHDAGLIRESVAAYVARDDAYRRWNTFDRA